MSSVPIPSGWRLAPVNPTDDMIHAWAGKKLPLTIGERSAFCVRYRRLLNMAPDPYPKGKHVLLSVEEIDAARPRGSIRAMVNPRFTISHLPDGNRLLQLYDVENGWQSFLIPKSSADLLVAMMTVDYQPAAPAPAPCKHPFDGIEGKGTPESPARCTACGETVALHSQQEINATTGD